MVSTTSDKKVNELMSVLNQACVIKGIKLLIEMSIPYGKGLLFDSKGLILATSQNADIEDIESAIVFLETLAI